jgi:type I restriction enzyme R subunit
MLEAYQTEYKWLSHVRESIRPSTGDGALLWHVLGAKTIELIHENVHVNAIHDDLDELVVDADLIEAIMGSPDPEKKAKEIEIKLSARLRKKMGNPVFKELSERLERLKERHESGQQQSLDFLKELLDIARDVVAAENSEPVVEDEDQGKSALTDLFQEVRNDDTPVMVERLVNDIDEIVRLVRFPGWQKTSAGEREVRKALRKTLHKYRLAADKVLFEKAYGYIKQYY